jgi:hypothetical protein
MHAFWHLYPTYIYDQYLVPGGRRSFSFALIFLVLGFIIWPSPVYKFIVYSFMNERTGIAKRHIHGFSCCPIAICMNAAAAAAAEEREWGKGESKNP